MEIETAILGSGIAGLACARRLVEAGHIPVIVDKGRGIGGRVATRRLNVAGKDLGFDHGAQYFTVYDPGLSAFMESVQGSVAHWDDGSGQARMVGCPGMTNLPKAIAQGFIVRQQTEVRAVSRVGSRWALETGSETFLPRRLVVTIPGPQALRLLGHLDPGIARIADVEMAPCLTLMAAFEPDEPRPFKSRLSDTDALSWIAQDSTKPGRSSSVTTWVAQASSEWSRAHLEEKPETIAPRMLSLLAETIGARANGAICAVAHRWRYARVVKPLGQPFLRAKDGLLWVGGDWCLGARVEAAWLSGDAIGRDLLKTIESE